MAIISENYNCQIALGSCRIQDKNRHLQVEYQNFNSTTQGDILIKHENFNFTVFVASLGHDIGECLFMTRLGHLGSLKLKRKSY